MGELKESWDEVGDRFAEVARRLMERFGAQGNTAGTRTDAPGDAGDASTQDRVDDALRTIASALEGAIAAVGDAVRDPATREEARRAATSLGDALGTTLQEVGEQIRRGVGAEGGTDRNQDP